MAKLNSMLLLQVLICLLIRESSGECGGINTTLGEQPISWLGQGSVQTVA